MKRGLGIQLSRESEVIFKATEGARRDKLHREQLIH